MPAATRIGLVDRPDHPGGRKTHDGEVPAIGGLAIAMAVAVTALVTGMSEQVHPAFWAGLIVIGLVGTLACSGRRLLNGNSPFKADRKHLHHILADVGLPVSKAVALIHAVAFLFGAVGVVAWARGVPEYVMFYVAMGIFAAYLVFSSRALRMIGARHHDAGGGRPHVARERRSVGADTAIFRRAGLRPN